MANVFVAHGAVVSSVVVDVASVVVAVVASVVGNIHCHASRAAGVAGVGAGAHHGSCAVSRRSGRLAEVAVGIAAVRMTVVAAAVAHKHRRTSVEHQVAAIVAVDAEVPGASHPCQRTIEVVGCHVAAVLPRGEHIAQVGVAASPVGAKQVGVAANTQQIVEVDFIYCVILRGAQVELVGHLVTQEQGFGASLGVCHCVCSDGYRHQNCQGEHLLHNRISYSLRG